MIKAVRTREFTVRELLSWLLVFLVMLMFCESIAYADNVYTWKDKNGVTHFGSKPPKGAMDAKILPKTTISRYSTEKMLSNFNTPRAQLKRALERSHSQSSRAEAARIAGDKTLGEREGTKTPNAHAFGLTYDAIDISRDEHERISFCSVNVSNPNSNVVKEIEVRFVFADGRSLLADGPSELAGNQSSVYQLVGAQLPLDVGANLMPRVLISSQ